MRRALLALVLAGCGAGSDVTSATMQLTADDAPSIAAVELLVFDGSGVSCGRALAAVSPLDDPGLDVVAHALFTLDGKPKHLALPAGKELVFYAEAYSSAGPGRARVGRGCVEQTLGRGSAPVSIKID
jgi:hypothetical protein